ncbi:MAG: ABC transporter permease [Candidatus Aminicenantes bacterium]|nr:MAG: ABC transporter permease [Candidatus Aminicenantes bacterium]
MKKKNSYSSRPPKIAQFLLAKTIDKNIRYSAIGDFDEIFASIAKQEGNIRARLWYWTQVAKSIPSFITDSLYWRFIMFQNYLKVAFRKMMRQKVFSFINIAGLAIGMAICILIYLWVQDELNYDKFHENANNIHRIVMNDQNYGVKWPVVSIPVGPALKQDFPEVLDSVRVNDFIGLITYEDKKFDEIGAYVDPSFLGIFSFPFVRGNAKTALNSPLSIVISEEMAEKLFGHEDSLGKNVKLNHDLDLTVTGVIKNIPENSYFDLDFLAPFEIFEKRDRDPTNWGRFQLYTYILLQDNTSFKQFETKIAGFLQEHDVRQGPQLELEPLTRIHLYAADGGGDIRYIYIFSIIAVFILAIACINFMNLTTARTSTRAIEIGMRKVTGARRKDLVKQFFGESVLLSLIALVFAVTLVFLLLPTLNNLTNKHLSLNPHGNWNIILGFAGIVLFAGFLAGSYPALFLSALKPVNILRGALIPTRGGAKRAVFRRILVVCQFAISVFLIISTFIIFKQLHFIQNRNLGYQKDRIITVPLRGNASQQYEAFKNELLRDSRIRLATATSEAPVLIRKIHMGYDWEGKNPKKESRMTEVIVDHDFIETFNMTIVQGRDFSKDFPSDSTEAYILNEAAVKTIGTDAPVGMHFSAPIHAGMREGTIIGVVKDFHFQPLNNTIEPLVMFIMPESFNYLCIRVQQDVSGFSGTIRYIESVWNKFAPNFPFQYSFLDATFDRLYRSEQKTGRIFGYFTFLAIFISCLGLFGLAAQIAEQRTKEIGIRKVMGATVVGITLLLTRDFMKWIIVANVIAWPTAYLAMNKWLQNYAYRTSIGIDIFVLAAVMALLIAFLTVSFQTFRAAIADPVDSLRYE